MKHRDQMKPVVSQENPANIQSIFYDWLIFGGVIFASLLHVTLCLAPVWEGVPNYAYMKVVFIRSLVIYGLFSSIG